MASPLNGRYFDNLSPVDGQLLCRIPRSDSADVEAALDAADAAKDKWAAVTAAERANVLNRIAQRMEDNLELLAVAETWDNGKPIRETKNADFRSLLTISVTLPAAYAHRKGPFPRSMQRP
jgi:aldehyde dehydrogenase